jgi:hypothetical protein
MPYSFPRIFDRNRFPPRETEIYMNPKGMMLGKKWKDGTSLYDLKHHDSASSISKQDWMVFHGESSIYLSFMKRN